MGAHRNHDAPTRIKRDHDYGGRPTPPVKPDKTRISITLTQPYMDALDHLIEKGIYLEHQVAIRDALRLLFRHHGIAPFAVKEVEIET